MAHFYPMDIIVPRQLQTYGDIELFKDINVGSLIQVQALNYTIERDRVVVVGYITSANLKESNRIEVPMDGLLVRDGFNYQINLKLEDNMPLPDQQLGSNLTLNKLKDQITPYNVPEAGKAETIWQTIKKIINPYELIDKFHTPNQLQRLGIKNNFIRYDRTQIFDTESLYPVITRAYFKLWEILVDTKVLDQYKDKPLNIANLAEGPGGFIQALIDYRNLQHHEEWKNDRYSAITLRKRNPRDSIQDWDYREGLNYFDHIRSNGYQVKTTYGINENGDLINLQAIMNFTDHDVREKCQLITGDGGIYLSEEEYGNQEYENAKLFFAEILTALHNQELKGTLILKIYDIYYHITVQMIHLLTLYYNNITIIKPHTSRPANSEKYLVCTDFTGDPTNPEFIESLGHLRELFEHWINAPADQHMSNLFDFHEKSESGFIKSIIEFNKYNLDLQMDKINEGLGLAMTGNYKDQETLDGYEQNKLKYGHEWCQSYQIHHV